MNVLYISYDGALDPLGSSQIIPYLVGLSERGIRITLLTYEKRERLNDIKMVETVKKNLADNNIKWELLRYHKTPTLLATLHDIVAGIVKGLVLLRRDKIRLIHARSFIGAIPALLLARFRSLKLVFDVRGLWPDERIEGGIWKKGCLLYKIANFCEKLLMLKSDYIVCLTEEARKTIEGFSYLKKQKKSIDVIPTSVDIVKFNPERKCGALRMRLHLEDKFILIYSGSLGTWYMIDEMIDFFLAAKALDQNVFFILLTPDSALVKEKMSEKGVGRGDYFTGFVSYDEMPFWLSEADLSVSFIRPTFSKRSSCPTKFAESLACGVPVIINSGIGDTEKVVLNEKVGSVINSFSDFEYKRVFRERIMFGNEKGNLTNRCRLAAERYFSLEDGISRYLKIYNKLL